MWDSTRPAIVQGEYYVYSRVCRAETVNWVENIDQKMRMDVLGL